MHQYQLRFQQNVGDCVLGCITQIEGEIRKKRKEIMYLYANGACPYAHEVSQHLITLPLHMWLTDEDVEKVIKVTSNYLK